MRKNVLAIVRDSDGEIKVYAKGTALRSLLDGTDIVYVSEGGYGELEAAEVDAEEWSEMPAKARKAVNEGLG
jgi:hypothetical protein